MGKFIIFGFEFFVSCDAPYNNLLGFDSAKKLCLVPNIIISIKLL